MPFFHPCELFMPYVLRARGPLKVTVARGHGGNLRREHTSHMAALVNRTTQHRQRFACLFTSTRFLR